jgi:polar amino acid transport system substrate-binding protein
MKTIALLFFFALSSIGHIVHIAMPLTKPPYIFEDTASGLEHDIIIESFKAVGIKAKPIFAPMNRGIPLFKSGKADGVINKLEHSLKGFPSDTYLNYHNVAASLKSRQLSIKSIQELSPFSVAAFQTAKVILGKEFDAVMSANKKYTEVAEQKNQVEQLLRKRVDVIVGDILIFRYYQRKFKEDANLDEEIAIHDIFATTPYKVMFKDAKLRDEFNKGLAIIRKNKVYSRLVERYGSDMLIDEPKKAIKK